MAIPLIHVDDIVVGEHVGIANIVVRLSEVSADTVTVSYNTFNLTATSPGDYTAKSGLLTFNPGVTSLIVPVILNPDALLEFTESFGLALSGATNALIGNAAAMATILDNDGATGLPVIRVADTYVDEKDAQAHIVVSLSRPSTGTVTVNYLTTNGTATAGSDFAAINPAQVLTFAPGEVSKTVTVNLVDDVVLEKGEYFDLTFSAATGASLPDATARVNIGRSDQAILTTPYISADDVVVGEGDGFAEFVIRMSGPSAQAVSIIYSVRDLTTNVGGPDWIAAGDRLTFAPGETEKTVRVALTDDNVVELNEVYLLQLDAFSITGGALVASNGVTATIIDNDGAPGTPILRTSDVVVDESAARANFVITLDRPSTSIVTVNYATSNGTATAGTDYSSITGTRTLSFAPGEVAKTISVDLIDDGVAEGRESFDLALSSAVGATLYDTRAQAVIDTSDQPAEVTPIVTVSNIVVGEGAGYAEFEMRMSAPSTQTATISFNTFDLSTGDTTDHVQGASVVSFAPGETLKTVRVALIDDAVSEFPETFGLALATSGAPVARVGSPAIATIIDNDGPAGTPIIRVSNAVVDETDGRAHFHFTLDRPSTAAVRVTYSTSAVTATSGTDFQSISSQTLVFAPGEVTKTVSVNVNDDPDAEGAELFALSLSNPVNASLESSRTFAILATNPEVVTTTPVISVAQAVATEGTGYLEFQVVLTRPTTQIAQADYGISTIPAGGAVPATQGSDFVSTSGRLLFAAGEVSKTVRVPLLNDSVVESTERLQIQLFNFFNVSVGNTDAAGIILDDDNGLSATEQTFGTLQNDYLLGTRAGDFLSGSSGDDTLVGGAGNDQMDGGGGNDLYIVEQSGDLVVEFGGSGQDHVMSYVSYTIADSGVEELTLLSSALNATGNASNNILRGNASDNTLNGQGGADSMAGGAGNDTYVVDDAGDVVIEASGSGTDLVQSQVSFSLLNASNVENLTLTGNGHVNATGHGGNNTLRGNSGNNTLDGGAGTDTLSYSLATGPVTVSLANAGAQNTGGAGVDTVLNFENLTGSAFNDVLIGDEQANVIDGGAGNDTLQGGDGNDTYIVGSLGDVIVEEVGGGIDTVQTSLTYSLAAINEVENVLITGTLARNATGNALNNLLTGNAAANVLTGLDGDDRLVGAAGSDTMIGGLGNDTFVVASSGDVIIELDGEGFDTVESSISYTLGLTSHLEHLTLTGSGALNGTGNSQDNTLTGNSGANTLSGGDGHDTLKGGGGADVLQGGLGNDRLTGGAGNDSLNGGAGLDQFVFRDALSSTTNVDVLGDFFSGEDIVVLGKNVFTTLLGSSMALDSTQFFAGAGATSATDTSDRIIYNTTNGNLYYDSDGIGGSASKLFAKLSSPVSLTATDFMVEI